MEKATSLISADELMAFRKVLYSLVQELQGLSGFGAVSRFSLDRIETVIKYNVLDGKQFRGILTILLCKHFLETKTNPGQSSKNQTISDDNRKLIYVLASCFEILQGSILIVDDIVDKSETRRGKVCWHLALDGLNYHENLRNRNGLADLRQINLKAFVDILQLESAASLLLARHFKDKDYASQLQILFHECLFKTTHGKILELQTRGYGNLEKFNMRLYEEIARLKTSVYTFLVPMMAAAIMTGGVGTTEQKQMEEFAYSLGHFYQVRDDMEDWTANEEVTGCKGTDITNGRCTWSIVTALNICNHEQRKILQENYGRDSDACRTSVVSVYREVGLHEKFSTYAEATYIELQCKINDMSSELPKHLLESVVQKVFGRNDKVLISTF